MVRTPVTPASKGGRTPAFTPGGPEAGEKSIIVTVRVRPLVENEEALNVEVWDCKDEHTLELKHTNLYTITYNFERVFDPLCPTQKVYDQGAKDVALSCLTGFNATIFAYGQTSSGKTFTMRGITENAVKDIYEHIRNTPERVFVLKFSALEIYNKTVLDLLSRESGPLRLLDDPERGIFVEKPVEEVANDSSHLMKLVGTCEAQRQVGETSLKDKTSRSHQIIRLTVESRPRGNWGHEKSLIIGSLDFVDLAGSEQTYQTDEDDFTSVMQILSYGKIGQNSQTAVICTISPTLEMVEQTRSTLSFALCAKENTSIAELLTEHKKATSDVGYWADLPYHLLTLIFSSLHGIDSVRFRLTCPEWKDTSIPIIRSGLPPLESGCPLGSGCPFLMHFSGHSTEKYRFLQPLTGEIYEEEHFLQLVDSPAIRCCRFGWLLMERSSSSLYFLNPFILPAKPIELPLSDYNLCLQSSTFTAPPTSRHCKVIIVGSTLDIITACTCRRGDNKWRIQQIKLRLPFQVAPCSPAMIGEFFFLLDTTGSLAAYMIHEDGDILFAFSGHPKGLGTAALVSTRYITQCRGTVLVVVVGLDHRTPIQIFELNCQGPELFWMPLETVDGIIFLSENSSMLVSSDTIGVQDRLYFKMVTAKTHKDNKGKHHLQECVFYTLKEQKYIGLWTDLDSEKLLDIEKLPLYMATWIQPKELKELSEEQLDWAAHYNEEGDADENDQWQGVPPESLLKWFVGGLWE